MDQMCATISKRLLWTPHWSYSYNCLFSSLQPGYIGQARPDDSPQEIFQNNKVCYANNRVIICNALSPWRNYSHSALWRIQSVTWSDLMDHQKSFTWLVMQPTNKWKLHYMYIRKDTLRPFLGMAETSVIVNLATLLIIVLLSYSKTEK